MRVENYKRVGLTFPEEMRQGFGVSARAWRAAVDGCLDNINKEFKPEELRLFRNGGESFELWLREFSINRLEQTLSGLSSNAGADAPIVEDLCRRVQKTVQAVGSYGVRGDRRLYVGYNKERKVAGRKAKELRRGKHYYANDNNFPRGENALPRQWRDKIVCADSAAFLRGLPDNCVDLVFTSPPYNFGLSYADASAGADDAADWQAYFDALFAVLDECARVLKHGGRLVVNVQPLFSDYIPSHHVISNHLMSKRLIWKGEILWEKNNYNCKYTAWGSWKSPSNPYLKYTWEFLEVFCKGALKKPGDAAAADIDAESFKKWVIGKWSIAPERGMKTYAHPAMFPEELARRVLLLFSFRGDIVLDPFAGAGTTCAVAKKHGRGYLGIDISKEYCATSKKRLAKILL